MEKPQYLSDEEYRILTELRKRLEKKLYSRPFRMVLFGSKARGDADEYSDLDVAIIVDGMDRMLKNTILDIAADIELEYLKPISTLVLSSQEFGRLLSRERRIAFDIEREGIAM